MFKQRQPLLAVFCELVVPLNEANSDSVIPTANFIKLLPVAFADRKRENPVVMRCSTTSPHVRFWKCSPTNFPSSKTPEMTTVWMQLLEESISINLTTFHWPLNSTSTPMMATSRRELLNSRNISSNSNHAGRKDWHRWSFCCLEFKFSVKAHRHHRFFCCLQFNFELCAHQKETTESCSRWLSLNFSKYLFLRCFFD